ncbi:MAG: hypothetical protein JNL32_02255 [Candidatus Kapabacteria bacterium]|nr:hypothetical protein [Candidatus Kapabacteria bacterium]
MKHVLLILCACCAAGILGCKDSDSTTTVPDTGIYTVVYSVTGNAQLSRIRYLGENKDTVSVAVTTAPWTYTWTRKGAKNERVFVEATLPATTRSTDSLVLSAKANTTTVFNQVVYPVSLGEVTQGVGGTLP